MDQPAPQPAAVPSIFTNEIFLRAGFGPDWGRVKVVLIAGNPENQQPDAWRAYDAADYLKAPHAHLNTYFSVGVQTGPSRGLAGFERIRVIVLDDVGVKVDLKKAIDLLGTNPSYITETSLGNCQAGWFTDIASRDWALGLVTALYRALGAGDNIKNLVGLMRLPVGTNHKPKCGPGGFKHRLRAWNPDQRINTLDWIAIEKRLGGVTPIAKILSQSSRTMPDPLEIEDDAILQAFRMLGAVQGLGRHMTMGWGFDVDCPWIAEHSERVHDGTSYVPVHQRFHCHHGHCQDRTMGDVRERLSELLKRDHGTTLATLEFDDVDPTKVRRPSLVGFAASTDEVLDPWDEKAPPLWPGNIFPAIIEDTLAELAQRGRLDHAALGATLMATASGAADKRVLLQPYAGDAWTVRPNQWVMLVAESGLRKTPLLHYPLKVLRDQHDERMRQYGRELAVWRKLPGAQRQQLPQPDVQALLAQDQTIEKLQEMMASNPRGLLYVRDELAALFGGFGRYSAGAGGVDRAFFLESYDGGSHTVGRMSRTAFIDNCALSILGTIQPYRLADFKDLADDGFLSRFGYLLLQKGQGAGQSTLTPPDVSAIDTTIGRLLQLGAFDPYRTDAAGEALIRATEADCEAIVQPPGIGPGYRGFLRKLHGLQARTALLLHLIDGGTDAVVPEDTVARAGSYVRLLLGHAEVFYEGFPGSHYQVAQAIAGYLLQRPQIRRVLSSQLARDVGAVKRIGKGQLKELPGIMAVLELWGWVKPETPYPSNNVWRVRSGLERLLVARRAQLTQQDVEHEQAKHRMGL
jgi:hypothetical protein